MAGICIQCGFTILSAANDSEEEHSLRTWRQPRKWALSYLHPAVRAAGLEIQEEKKDEEKIT